jgi:hypothetical protein
MNLELENKLIESISDMIVDDIRKSDSLLNTPNTLSNLSQDQLLSETLGLGRVFRQGSVVEGIKIGTARSGNRGHAGREGKVGGSAPGGARNKTDDEIRQSIQDQRLLVSIYGGSPGITKKEYELSFDGMTVADRLKFMEMNASKIKGGSGNDDPGDVPPEFAFTEYGWQIQGKVPKGLNADQLRAYLKENNLVRDSKDVADTFYPRINLDQRDLIKGLSDAEKDEFVEEFPKSSKRAIDDGKYQVEIIPYNEVLGLSVSQLEKLSDNFEGVSGYKGLKLKDGDIDYHNRMDDQKLNLGEFSKDKEVALTSLLSGWAITGGGIGEQKIVREVSAGLFPINKGVLFYDSVQPGIDPGKRLYSKTRMAGHLASLKAETEDFYKKKFAKKSDPNPDLSMKTFDVYRGDGGHQEKYQPAAAESWTAQRGSANVFGKMMKEQSYSRIGHRPQGPGTYSVLSSKVSYIDIFWSYESVKGKYGWPEDKDLKGKKEFVVLGGSIIKNGIVQEKLYA